MTDFQVIAGLASIFSFVISVIAICRANHVKKIITTHMPNIRQKMKGIKIKDSGNTKIIQGETVQDTNIINVYIETGGRLSSASNLLEELNGKPLITDSKKNLQKWNILSEKLKMLKRQYSRLSPGSEMVQIIRVEISEIEVEIEELRKRIGKID